MTLKETLIVPLSFGSAFLFPGSSYAQQKVQKPNIIIIYTDDQGTLDAGCYGASDLHTPNIDRLSKSGILFTQA